MAGHSIHMLASPQGTLWLVNLPDVARTPFHVRTIRPTSSVFSRGARQLLSVAVQCIMQAFSSTGQGKVDRDTCGLYVATQL
jgi:hypothetical protein